MTHDNDGEITKTQLNQLENLLTAFEELTIFGANDFVGDDEHMIKAVADASQQVNTELMKPSEAKDYINSQIPMCETARKRVEEYQSILEDIKLLSGDVQMQTILKRILRFCAPDECCGENKVPKVPEPESVIAMYRDGGTVHISEPSIELYIDRRIKTKTPGAIFHVYPDKGESIKGEAVLNAAKIVLNRAKVAHPSHRCTIAEGLEWVDQQLENLKNV